MKKIFISIMLIFLAILSIIWFRFQQYKKQYNVIQDENLKFNEYYQKEIYGIDLISLINKAVDNNIQNKIEQDEQKNFIDNNKNSIIIEIKIMDNDKIYRMEKFYNNGMKNFRKYYGNIKFMCKQIDYHESTQKVKYLYFEQII